MSIISRSEPEVQSASHFIITPATPRSAATVPFYDLYHPKDEKLRKVLRQLKRKGIRPTEAVWWLVLNKHYQLTEADKTFMAMEGMY